MNGVVNEQRWWTNCTFSGHKSESFPYIDLGSENSITIHTELTVACAVENCHIFLPKLQFHASKSYTQAIQVDCRLRWLSKQSFSSNCNMMSFFVFFLTNQFVLKNLIVFLYD